MAQSELLVSTPPAEASARYSLLVAHDDADVLAAQRLRYQVFAEEMGANLHTEVPGLDADYFDQFCDHLVVRHDPTGEIVGCYRMLPPNGLAKQAASTPTANST